MALVRSVMLLHGFCGSARGWGPTLGHLSRYMNVLAPDWPGYGSQSGQAVLTSVETMTAHALRCADAAGLARFDVIGHSMSGFVVQQLLTKHSDRIGRAVLYGAGLRMDQERRFESAQATRARLLGEGVQATVERVVATWFTQGRDDPAYPAAVQAGLGMTAEAGIAAMHAFERVDFTDRLAAVEREVLVIIGDGERTFPPAMALQLAQAIPGARLCILPQCGHAAHLEHPDLFHSVVRDFLLRRLQ